LSETDAEKDPRFIAGVDLIRRTGAKQFQIRYSDDEEPVVWFAVALYEPRRWEADAGGDPLQAVMRLCERLVDGGTCAKCGRPTGIDPALLGQEMPMPEMICWWQFDPGMRKFIRGCD
jgi:hypothetical protein